MAEQHDVANEREQFQFQAEIQQVLHILIHSLYTHREIFVRELISNASDALNRVQFEMLTNQDVRDPELELAITLEADKDARIIRISDTGIGMTRDDMIKNLGTVAQSGAKAFLQKLGEANPTNSSEIIGQFGVGFYSVFMAADEVRVTSLSHQPDATAWRWTSRGEATYTLEAAERSERGTTIEIVLKEDAEEYAERWKLEQIVRQHSNFVAFPIYSAEGDEKKVLNQRTALWRKQPREVTQEEYNDFYRQTTMDFSEPLSTVHISTDAPVDLHAILFLPAKREQGMMRQIPDPGLKLYSRKVLIQDRNEELLPKHLRFVQGVVDSEDLPLNVSRETVQSSGTLRQIAKIITNKITKEIETLADNDAEKFAEFWREFGPYFKEGLVTDPGTRSQIEPLLRFHSTNSEGLTKLSEYVERMKEGQEDIYYVIADNVETARRSPHLDYFNERGYEVLLMHEPIDSFVISSLRDFQGKKLRSVDDADIAGDDVELEGSLSAATIGQLGDRIKELLGEQISEVRGSKLLRSNPVRLAAPSDDFGRDMDRIRRMMGQEYSVPSRILELNPRHAIVHNLAALLDEPDQAELFKVAVEQLYGTALLGEGLHPNPSELISGVHALIAAATKKQ
ncbi:molecular chaperone HtpG [Herpetosiphon geysericola]|uniref:Chaperone protein HtpG n=1 Tax=Herpetosiphon geysericola TaxID=70996 RepID=A0A0P6Y9X9_9CHLR|nr:molecular chaperone HtpG [Herpetosiphon geysericola]KPL86040.1 molecular chaperone Hsp90 [Herpetosiphon geysericola]